MLSLVYNSADDCTRLVILDARNLSGDCLFRFPGWLRHPKGEHVVAFARAFSADMTGTLRPACCLGGEVCSRIKVSACP